MTDRDVNAAVTATVEKSRPSEEAFRLLVQSVKDYAIFMLDPEGHITTWNQGAQNLKGYSASEIIGKHFSTFYKLEDVEAGKPQYELDTALANGRVEDEGWRVRKDGTEFWANVVITAVYDHMGVLRGFAKVTRDLTERRRLEQEQVKVVQAREAIRLRDEFLSIASHELRTPINALGLQLAAFELMLGKRSSDDAGLRDQLTRAKRQVVRLNELIERLLDVSRLRSGHLTLQIARMDIMASLRETVGDFAREASAAGCTIHLQGPEAVWGNWDRLRIEQVIMNVLSNAIKYGAGGPIEIAADAGPSSVCVSITDHGAGIAAEYLEKIFERFERGSAARDRGGLGVGLYIARSLVEAHHGTIDVDTELGCGSTFSFTLPYDFPPSPSAEQDDQT